MTRTTTEVTTTTQEILESVTGVKRWSKEGKQKYLARLVDATDTKVVDAEYKKFPKVVTEWLNKAIDAANGDIDIPDLPDTEIPISDIEASASDINHKPEEKSKMTKTKVKPTEKATKKVATKKVAEKEGKGKHLKVVKKTAAKAEKRVYQKGTLPKSITSAVRQLVLQHPKASREDIHKKLKDAGVAFSPTTLSVTYSATQEMIEIQRQLKLTF